MEKEGVVSIWLGNGGNRSFFTKLLEYRIDKNGEFEACPFCQSLGINSYDPDYFGGKYFPKEITSPRILFHGTELIPVIQAGWSELPPSNCYVLLYNYEYEGSQRILEMDGFSFRFLGCFRPE